MTDKPRVLDKNIAALIRSTGRWDLDRIFKSHERLRELALEALDHWRELSRYSHTNRPQNLDRIAAIRKELEGENGE